MRYKLGTKEKYHNMAKMRHRNRKEKKQSQTQNKTKNKTHNKTKVTQNNQKERQ